MIGEPSRQTSLNIDLGGEQVLLQRIEAVEALSTPFLITLDIISELGEIDLLPHLGKPASVSISQDEELQRYRQAAEDALHQAQRVASTAARAQDELAGPLTCTVDRAG